LHNAGRAIVDRRLDDHKVMGEGYKARAFESCAAGVLKPTRFNQIDLNAAPSINKRGIKGLCP